jgi:dephospho-CoA kinase
MADGQVLVFHGVLLFVRGWSRRRRTAADALPAGKLTASGYGMLSVGLTGGIGSGKSTVSDFFKALGASLIDADVIARQVVEPGQPALQKILERFGPNILTENGTLNRSGLRARVFADAGLRQDLESILHPLIRARILEDIGKAPGPYCIVAIPLLAESNYRDYHLDRILVVDAPESAQIARTQRRDGVSDEDVQAIMNSQVTRAARLRIADDVIYNDGSLAQLKQQVLALHHKYLKLGEAQRPVPGS